MLLLKNEAKRWLVSEQGPGAALTPQLTQGTKREVVPSGGGFLLASKMTDFFNYSSGLMREVCESAVSEGNIDLNNSPCPCAPG